MASLFSFFIRSETKVFGSSASLILGAGVLLQLTQTGCVTMKTAESRGGETIVKESVLPVPGSRLGKGSGGLLLVSEFKFADGGPQSFECRWRMVNQETGKSYFVDLAADRSATYTQIDPGTYKTSRLGCGMTRVWDIDDVFKDGFRVEDGSVSYLGKLSFEFKKGELQTVRKAPRSESAKAFAAALDSTQAGGLTVISGFTGRKIDRSMLEGDAALGFRDSFDVYAKGASDPAKALEALVTQLKKCANENNSIDPLSFGHLEYIAIYKEGRFSEMKSRREQNAFTDKLKSCVERGMMAFHPEAKNELEIRVRY